MKTTLPVREKELLDDGTVKVKDYNIEVDVDTSLNAQDRFQAHFPELAQHEDLETYTKRIYEHKEMTMPVLMSKIKSFYCWIDTDVTFKDFNKLIMGCIGDEDYRKKIIKKLDDIANAISNGSSEKN